MGGGRVAGFAGAVMLGLLASCARDPAAVTLEPAVRVLDVLRSSSTSAIVHGADVTLGREMRRTVALPASTAGMLTLDAASEPPRYRLRFLSDLGETWPRVRVQRIAEIRGTKTVLPPDTVGVDMGARTVPVAPFETAVAEMMVAVHAAMPGPTTTIDTAPFIVPPSAVLTFAVGEHAPAGTTAPVGARVSIVEGRRARAVWRTVLPGSGGVWRDQRVSLAGFAGHTIRLRFTSHARSHAEDTGMLAVFGEPLVLAPRIRAARPFNVVLVSMDTLRARSLGAYGATRPTSPTLDAFADDGALFENAFSTASFTLPGHMSMLTGLWFRTHGAIVVTSVLDPAHRTLAEALQAAGYATGAFTSGAWIMPWTGFRRGFDTYFEQASNATGATRTGGGPYDAFTHALDWIAINTDRPVFAFVHNYVVHLPYRAPRPYDTMFDPVPPDASDDERQVLEYEREVRYADDQVRALLEGLASHGLADRTLVIVTADHGEQFGEHGGHEHTYDVHDTVAHVPLLMRLPGAIAAGVTIAEPVSLADVVPTVVDLLGLPPVEGADGQSLVPLMTGTMRELPRDGVFSEAASAPKLDRVDLVAVRTRSHGCIHDARGDTYECYDRRVDPWERTPLDPNDTSPGVRRAHELLHVFETAHAGPGSLPSTPPSDATTAAPGGDVTGERREQLRALGYVE